VQIALVWWSLAFAVIFGLAFGLLLHMVPPPDATMSAEEVKAWYQDHASDIKIGATIASYTSAFLVPLFVVIGAQMRRAGYPILGTLTVIGGSFASIFLVLPPLVWGVCAYNPDRAADATAVMHEFALMMLVTTDQYYIFPWVAMIVISFLPTAAAHSPFPRWYGYLNMWFAAMFELGALAFNFRSGPFSWKGLFVFYTPFTLFTAWISVPAYRLLTNIKRQGAEADPGAHPARPDFEHSAELTPQR
jgi:hypothetical protein